MDGEVVRSVDDAYSPDGGLKVMRGNLAPDCGVVKKSAVAPEMWQHSGPARVFDSEEEACRAIFGGAINPGDVVVIRYEGPAGGPGMREMLTPHLRHLRHGTRELGGPHHRRALLRRLQGPVHRPVSPEAAAGGPIALVQEGDTIDIDIQAARSSCASPQTSSPGAAPRGSRPRPSTPRESSPATQGWSRAQTRGLTSHDHR